LNDGFRCICNGDSHYGPTSQNGAANCTERTCRNVENDTAVNCGTGASCSDSDDSSGYVCACTDIGYYGHDVVNGMATCNEKSCYQSGVESVPLCGDGAVCDEGSVGDGYVCECTHGYEGRNGQNEPAVCIEKNECDLSPCLNGATCVDGLNFYTCECQPNNFGVHCNETHNDCISGNVAELCGNGTCVDLNRTDHGIQNYACQCNAGYSSPDDQEECSIPVPCPGISLGDNVVAGCTCPPGFNGQIVATRVEPYYEGECAELACVDESSGSAVDCGSNALCSDGETDDGYTCLCGDGYYGALVTNKQATCEKMSCSNDGDGDAPDCGIGATCEESQNPAGYTCICTGPYYGGSSFNQPAVCIEKTCEDGGAGFPPACGESAFCRGDGSSDGYQCECKDSHYGTTVTNEAANCTAKTCNAIDEIGTDAHCGSGALCRDEPDGQGYVCECLTGYHGAWGYNGSAANCTEASCENSGVSGAAAVCGTGAVCNENNEGAGYICACSTNLGFYGESGKLGPANCTEATCNDIDGGGTPATCGQHAICGVNQNGGGYECICEWGYYGESTENERAICTEMSCDNVDGNFAEALCGPASVCDDGEDDDGYFCLCDQELGYFGEPSQNQEASCKEMSCSDVDGNGIEANCGANAACNEGYRDENSDIFLAGYICECIDGYHGSSVINGETTCEACDSTCTTCPSDTEVCQYCLADPG